MVIYISVNKYFTLIKYARKTINKCKKIGFNGNNKQQ